MKIALCTTTIHVPHALKLLRKCSESVEFFVALDNKSPTQEILNSGQYRIRYLTPDMQVAWKCSEAIGWNTIARRNIAFLEALKWGADVIYSWDDDNIPTQLGHFDAMRFTFDQCFSGIKVGAYHWFDPGSLLIPHTRHRGFPSQKSVQGCEAVPVVDAKIGVAAGLVIGDPDIDATTRMEQQPYVSQVHLLGQTGVVVDLNTWTVFNSQNTAVIRELIPAWFMMPGVGRHDDIYASLIVQRVARECNLHVHFGPPFTYQQRNAHNLIADLRAEIDGMENVTKLAELLDAILLPGKSVIGDTRMIYQTLCHCAFIPLKSAEAGLLWLEDCEGVM